MASLMLTSTVAAGRALLPANEEDEAEAEGEAVRPSGVKLGCGVRSASEEARITAKYPAPSTASVSAAPVEPDPTTYSPSDKE